MQEIGKDKLEEPRQFGSQPEPGVGFDTEESEQATEDEQLNYDLLVVRARKMMFGKSREKILTMLGSTETPSQGIGQVAAMLIKSLSASAKENGRDISSEVAINAGAEIAEDLSDLAKSAGVYTYDSEQDEISELEDSLLWGVKYYGDGMLQSGEATPEMQAEAQKITQEGNQREYDNAPKPKNDKVRDAVQGAVAPPGGGIVNNMAGGM